jgi:hypothetical protein
VSVLLHSGEDDITLSSSNRNIERNGAFTQLAIGNGAFHSHCALRTRRGAVEVETYSTFDSGARYLFGLTRRKAEIRVASPIRSLVIGINNPKKNIGSNAIYVY